MKAEAVASRLAAQSSGSEATETSRLVAENARLVMEVRRATAIADGLQLGIRAAQERLDAAKIENAALQRKLQRQQGIGAEAERARRFRPARAARGGRNVRT